MSLKIFHKVFILTAIACLITMARWANGHNQAGMITPWAFYTSIILVVILIPYFMWTVKKL